MIAGAVEDCARVGEEQEQEREQEMHYKGQDEEKNKDSIEVGGRGVSQYTRGVERRQLKGKTAAHWKVWEREAVFKRLGGDRTEL